MLTGHVADSTIVFAVLAVVVVLFVTNRVPVDIVAVGTALTLWATGVLDLNAALAGFGDPTVVYIASLFVVSEALDSTGVTTWAGQQLVHHAGASHRRLLVLMMLACAALTALISVNGAVAALLPVVVVTAVRTRQPASRLLMPLAFAAHAGSMLALTGSPVNIIVSEAANDATGDYFGFFEFTLVGVPLVIGTVAIVVLLGRRLLPDRQTRYISKDFSTHAMTLLRQYELDNDPESPLYDRRTGVAEVIIPPRSGLIGVQAFPGMVTDSGDLVVLAVQRKGVDLEDYKTVLAAGDTLLLQGTWNALSEQLEDPDVLVVDAPHDVRRQALPFGPGARRASVVLVVMVVLLAAGAVPPAVASLLAAGALDLVPSRHDRAGLPVDLVDHRRAGRRDDPVVDGDDRQRRRRQDRRPTGGDHRRFRCLSVADRIVRIDRRARTAHQQHRNDPCRHPDRRVRRRRGRCLGAPGADVAQRRRLRRPADSGRHAGERDDHGPGRLPASATTPDSDCRCSPGTSSSPSASCR